jgi:hypothetical protein
VTPERRDRVPDWKDELRRLMPSLPELPEQARLAVSEVVVAFAREDALDPALHFGAWPGPKARS